MSGVPVDAPPPFVCPAEGISGATVTREGSDLTVQTGDATKVRLTVIDPSVVRVWAVPADSSFEKAASYSVRTEAWLGAEYDLCDRGDYIQVHTSELSVRVYEAPLRVDFYEADDRTPLSEERASGGMSWNGTEVTPSLTRRIGPEEHFYGLGEDNDALLGNLDRRGTVRDMWTGQEINSGHVTADIPIAFFMSTGQAGAGYGMFFDNSHRSRFDMGQAEPDHFSWSALGGELLYYLIRGPSFAKIIDHYTSLTGRPSLPPLWSLGYIQSKCTYYTWEEVDSVVANMRSRSIPLDVMVLDYDWAAQLQNFQWNARWNGQSPAKLADYERQGVKFLLSNSGPMIRKDSSNYQSGLAQGIFATDGNGNTVTCGHYGGDLIDCTSPNLKSWLWPQLQHLFDEGVDGWWLDLTEPEGEPPQTVYMDGPSAKIHNVYSLLLTKTYFEMQKKYAPDTRPFVLTRTGYAGIQKYGASIWTGDTHSDYETLQAHPPEGLNAGLSGIPFWTNDTGGFLEGLYRNNEIDHGLLYERWMQFSTFSPITRAHHVGLSAPYMFGQAVEEGLTKYIQLRYRLLPYIYSYARQAHQTGAPMMRPLVYEYPSDPNVYNLKDEYLFGNELLVAPVLQERRTNREVYFPKGTWIDYDYGYIYEGGRSYRVSAAQDHIPVAVRAGAIIPMAPLMQYSGEKAWDPITLDIYPSGVSHFVLYRDDGQTMAFETQGSYTETTIRCAETSSLVQVDIDESNKQFTPGQYAVILHLKANPRAVTLDGRPLLETAPDVYEGSAEGWFWDAPGMKLHAKLTTSSALHYAVQIATDAIPLVRPLAPELVPDPPLAIDAGPDPAAQAPYIFPPPSVPGRIEVENYDEGGEGVAVHDNTPGNSGGQYRTDDVDIGESQDVGGGRQVTAEAGEWLEYTFNASEASAYAIQIRVAAPPTAGQLRLEFDGLDLTGPVDVTAAANGQAWIDVNTPNVSLRAGAHVLRLVVLAGILDVNYVLFTALAGVCADIPPDNNYTCAQQAAWAKCAEAWMVGYCQASCGGC